MRDHQQRKQPLRRAPTLFVDVEGFEPQVLRGRAAASERNCAALALEITLARYSPTDATDLQHRIAAYSETLTLLPSGTEHPTLNLLELMRRHRQGHFDIAMLRIRKTS